MEFPIHQTIIYTQVNFIFSFKMSFITREELMERHDLCELLHNNVKLYYKLNPEDFTEKIIRALFTSKNINSRYFEIIKSLIDKNVCMHILNDNSVRRHLIKNGCFLKNGCFFEK